MPEVYKKGLVIGTYLLVLVGIGLWASRRSRLSLEDYFVASRGLGPLILLLTMAATNFSAFTVFGFSGAGWRVGYAFYPIMAFGTGFMALAFHFIGRPVWRLGKEEDLLTPPELVFYRFDSQTLRLVFLAVMVIFTLPYLAMQPMAAGYALKELIGIPYFAGASLITVVMLSYTFLGGMRGVAWTDAFQGGAMLVFLLATLVCVAAPFGGLTAANKEVALQWPGHFSRPGTGGAFPPGIWLGYMLLWLLADPMFPHLFQRFYTARDERSLSMTMSLYPLVTGILFLLPVTIGVIGRLAYPELPGEVASDRILPLLLSRYAPPVLETLVLTAAMAALMSTLDSQLLSLSSMFTRDIYEPWRGRSAPPWIGKLFVVALALAGLGIAWRPPATFLDIATETFTGLAVLFPTVLAALYWPRVTTTGAIASILVGEGLVGAYHFQVIPSWGTLPVIPVVAAAGLVLVVVSLLARRPTGVKRKIRVRWGWILVPTLLFVLGNDFWNWGDGRMGPLGYPWWVWYFLGLCIALAAAFWQLSKTGYDVNDKP